MRAQGRMGTTMRYHCHSIRKVSKSQKSSFKKDAPVKEKAQKYIFPFLRTTNGSLEEIDLQEKQLHPQLMTVSGIYYVMEFNTLVNLIKLGWF